MNGAFIQVQEDEMTILQPPPPKKTEGGAPARKRAVGFALEASVLDSLDGNTMGRETGSFQRRGTPHPHKKMKEGGATKDQHHDHHGGDVVLPPPVFTRTESAALCGIPPYNPKQLKKMVAFADDDGLEEHEVRAMIGSVLSSCVLSRFVLFVLCVTHRL